MHVPSELASKIEDITFATAKKIDLDLNTTKFYLNKRKLFIENERELQKCKKCRSKECGLLKRNKEIEVLIPFSRYKKQKDFIKKTFMN